MVEEVVSISLGEQSMSVVFHLLPHWEGDRIRRVT